MWSSDQCYQHYQGWHRIEWTSFAKSNFMFQSDHNQSNKKHRNEKKENVFSRITLCVMLTRVDSSTIDVCYEFPSELEHPNLNVVKESTNDVRLLFEVLDCLHSIDYLNEICQLKWNSLINNNLQLKIDSFADAARLQSWIMRMMMPTMISETTNAPMNR
jgi:hypothetical protein